MMVGYSRIGGLWAMAMFEKKKKDTRTILSFSQKQALSCPNA